MGDDLVVVAQPVAVRVGAGRIGAQRVLLGVGQAVEIGVLRTVEVVQGVEAKGDLEAIAGTVVIAVGVGREGQEDIDLLAVEDRVVVGIAIARVGEVDVDLVAVAQIVAIRIGVGPGRYRRRTPGRWSDRRKSPSRAPSPRGLRIEAEAQLEAVAGAVAVAVRIVGEGPEGQLVDVGEPVTDGVGVDDRQADRLFVAELVDAGPPGHQHRVHAEGGRSAVEVLIGFDDPLDRRQKRSVFGADQREELVRLRTDPRSG